MCLSLFYPAKCEKILETVNAASATVTNLLITLPVPDDPTNFHKSLRTVITELAPRRLFQTCTWGNGTNSVSGAYSTVALLSKQLRNKIQRI